MRSHHTADVERASTAVPVVARPLVDGVLDGGEPAFREEERGEAELDSVAEEDDSEDELPELVGAHVEQPHALKGVLRTRAADASGDGTSRLNVRWAAGKWRSS